MKILVCVKQVPKMGSQTLLKGQDTIVRTKQNSIINPLDLTALSHAISVKKMTESVLTVISMGPISCVNNLQSLLALDVDKVVLLCDSAFAGADTIATAYTLSEGIRQLGSFDYIFCGEHTIDGDTGHLGACLAEKLKIPHIANISEISLTDHGTLRCSRETEESEEIFDAIGPALLTVNGKSLTSYIEPTIEGVAISDSKPFVILDQKLIHADRNKCGLSGSPTNVIKCSFREIKSSQAKSVHISNQEEVKGMFKHIWNAVDRI